MRIRSVFADLLSASKIEKIEGTPSFHLHVSRHLGPILITDDFEFIIIIFCGCRGPTLGGGAFFVRMVINYYGRQKERQGRRGAGVGENVCGKVEGKQIEKTNECAN